MFTGAHKISMTSKKNTPYTVDWTSTTTDVGEGAIAANTNTQTLSGIGVPITIKLQFTTAVGTTGTMSYFLNSGSQTTFTNDTTLTINNGSTLQFRRTSNTAQAGSTTVLTIINVSDNNKTLDTVSMNAFI